MGFLSYGSTATPIDSNVLFSEGGRTTPPHSKKSVKWKRRIRTVRVSFTAHGSSINLGERYRVIALWYELQRKEFNCRHMPWSDGWLRSISPMEVGRLHTSHEIATWPMELETPNRAREFTKNNPDVDISQKRTFIRWEEGCVGFCVSCTRKGASM